MALRQGKTVLISSVRCVHLSFFFPVLLAIAGMEALMAQSVHAPGDIIDGRYKLVTLLGSGSFAQVWLVWNIRLRQHQALKILQLSHPQVRQRFQTEALAAAELSGSPDWRSKFIIRVFDVSDAVSPVQWMAMEHVDGGDLWDYLDHSTPSTHTALQIALDIAYGLQLAHGRKVGDIASPIVHRDLKPQNILLDKNHQIKITDFGIASVLHVMDENGGGEAEHGTRIGATMGTVGWSAPEQLKDASKQDVRGDIFSLGVILAALAADFDPGVGNATQMIHFPRVQDACLADVAPSVRLIIVTACNTDPDLRYTSIDAMIDAIQEALALFPATHPAWTLREGKQLPPRPSALTPQKTPQPGSTMIPDEPRPAPPTVQPMAMTDIDEFTSQWPLNRRQAAFLGLFGTIVVALIAGGIHFWPRASTDTPVPDQTLVRVPVPETSPPLPIETHTEPVPVAPIEPPPKPVIVPVPVVAKPKIEAKPSVAQGGNPPIAQASVTLLHLPSSVHPGETVTVSAKLAVPKDQTVASVTLRYLGSSGGAKQHAEMKVAPDGVTATGDFTVSPSLGTSVTVYADLRLESDLGTQVPSKKETIPIN